MNVQEAGIRSAQTRPGPSISCISPVARDSPWLAHTGVELEPGILAAFPVILCPTADWHRFAAKSAQKRRKTPVNRALRVPKTDRKSFIQMEISHNNTPPPGVLLLLFAFRQSRPHFQFMQLPWCRRNVTTSSVRLVQSRHSVGAGIAGQRGIRRR